MVPHQVFWTVSRYLPDVCTSNDIPTMYYRIYGVPYLLEVVLHDRQQHHAFHTDHHDRHVPGLRRENR